MHTQVQRLRMVDGVAKPSAFAHDALHALHAFIARTYRRAFAVRPILVSIVLPLAIGFALAWAVLAVLGPRFGRQGVQPESAESSHAVAGQLAWQQEMDRQWRQAQTDFSQNANWKFLVAGPHK